jgi:hypothetical protein
LTFVILKVLNFPAHRDVVHKNFLAHRDVVHQINVTQSDCVFVALGIHHALLMRHIFCGTFRLVLTVTDLKTLEVFG